MRVLAYVWGVGGVLAVGLALGALFAFGSVFLYRRTDTSIRDDVFFRAGVVVLALALADFAVGLFVDDEAQNETVLLGLPIAVVWVALAALHRRRVAA